jgi:hypothetical protein
MTEVGLGLRIDREYKLLIAVQGCVLPGTVEKRAAFLFLL